MKKIYYLLFLFSNLIFSQQSIISSNYNFVGLEHNLLFNATKRYQVSQTGPNLDLNYLFDGSFFPSYTTTGVNSNNRTEILIENLSTIHTQVGAWVGWSTRYYYPFKFKIEGYNVHNGKNQWETFSDYSNTNYYEGKFYTSVGNGGTYTKLKFTFIEGSGPNNLMGISELFFVHPEATKPYEGLLTQTSLTNSSIGEWNKLSNNINYLQGNVGIGISNPQNKLDVNGTIHAKEVKVDMNGWADHVFDSEYKLKSLNDLEGFIRVHKHLPNIPSEKDVLDEGIFLGELNVKLLEKIEELTLYIIEQNKINTEQSKQFEEQILSNKKLEQRVQLLEKLKKIK